MIPPNHSDKWLSGHPAVATHPNFSPPECSQREPNQQGNIRNIASPDRKQDDLNQFPAAFGMQKAEEVYMAQSF